LSAPASGFFSEADMKRLTLMACVVFAVLAATPAKAEVMVIRWKSGLCQLWDTERGAPPRKSVQLVGGFATWIEALAAMNGLHTQRQCGSVPAFPR
jgi:hypothetical protein